MIAVACVFLFLAIKKGFEPLLLVPIAFGMLPANIPELDPAEYAVWLPHYAKPVAEDPLIVMKNFAKNLVQEYGPE
jgi:Na+-transporting methylmalonyl-CoA/oxaloacetate decarboxylase beta subunit